MLAGFICQSRLKSFFLLPLSLLCFLVQAFFSFWHHMFLFKPKHGPVMAECHRPPGLSIEPVNGDFDPWPLFWHPLCLRNSVDFVIELCKWKWGQVRVILAAAACVCVCVFEYLAIILHAWCLYLASPSPSLSLFLSLSPYVDISAYPRLYLHTVSLSRSFVFWFHFVPSLFMHFTVCQWFTTRDRHSTYGARWAQIHLILWADLSVVVLSRHIFVIKLSLLV